MAFAFSAALFAISKRLIVEILHVSWFSFSRCRFGDPANKPGLLYDFNTNVGVEEHIEAVASEVGQLVCVCTHRTERLQE